MEFNSRKFANICQIERDGVRAKFEVTVRVTLSLPSLSSMLKIPDKNFQNGPIKQLDTTQIQLHAQRSNGRDETLFQVFDVTSN